MNVRSSSARGAHRLRDRLREETVRTLLEAAEQVFAEGELTGASMAQIAQRAGVAVGTLYNHFKDRDALFAAVADLRRSELLEKLDQRHAELVKEPFQVQLTGFLRAFFDHFEEHRAFLLMLFVSEPICRPDPKEVKRAIHQRIEALLKVGHREKALRPDTSRSFGVLLLGSVRAMFLREKFGAAPLDSASSVQAVLEFFLAGAGRRT